MGVDSLLDIERSKVVIKFVFIGRVKMFQYMELVVVVIFDFISFLNDSLFLVGVVNYG